MSFRIGIDVGGTFVDLMLVDGGQVRRFYKSLSRPEAMADAVEEGLEAAAADQGMPLEELLSQTEVIIHGSTVAVNSLLTRSGATTCLLTTAGFRDILSMRRGLRENQYDPRQEPLQPLIPRHRIHAIRERVDCEGTELLAVDPDSLDSAVREIRSNGVESVAVGLLFSYLNPNHEEQLAATLAKELPGVHVSLSSQVLSEVRLYERISTTVVNAYVTPVLARYLESLEARLQSHGYKRKLLIMQSNGGVMSSQAGRRFGVRSILSGPAAAPVAGRHYGSLHSVSNVITMDMGGTSCDLCLIQDGEVEVTREMEVDGHRIALPLVAVHAIGAGGGSLLSLDARGLLQVGPDSAGSTPGPACYGRGGTRPTVTDADLLLGYLDPERFWGGRLTLDRQAASQAVETELAEPLGLTIVEAAHGAYQVVNANMVDAIREISVQRGYDPRRFMLLGAGGAGAIHAAAIARELEMPLVMVPREASVLCASGLLLSDLRHDFVRSCLTLLEELDLVVASDLYRQMEEQAVGTLLDEGVERDEMVLTRSADVRYVGQFTEVEVALETGRLEDSAIQGLARSFHQRHELLNGYSMPSVPLEVVNLRVLAKGIQPKASPLRLPTDAQDQALLGHRQTFFQEEFQQVSVYDGFRLLPGMEVTGPALIEQETTTVVVPPGWNLSCDGYGNYLLWDQQRGLEETLVGLKMETPGERR